MLSLVVDTNNSMYVKTLSDFSDMVVASYDVTSFNILPVPGTTKLLAVAVLRV